MGTEPEDLYRDHGGPVPEPPRRRFTDRASDAEMMFFGLTPEGEYVPLGYVSRDGWDFGPVQEDIDRQVKARSEPEKDPWPVVGYTDSTLSDYAAWDAEYQQRLFGPGAPSYNTMWTPATGLKFNQELLDELFGPPPEPIDETILERALAGPEKPEHTVAGITWPGENLSPSMELIEPEYDFYLSLRDSDERNSFTAETYLRSLIRNAYAAGWLTENVPSGPMPDEDRLMAIWNAALKKGKTDD